MSNSRYKQVGVDKKLSTLRLLLFLLGAHTLAYATALAQEVKPPYPSSSLIEASVLAPEARLSLETLLRESLPQTEISKIKERLCPHAISRSSVRDESLRPAITETKVSVTTELLFQRLANGSTSMIDSFPMTIEFTPTRVLMRHMRPRFPSDLPGYSAPLSDDVTRPLRIEGEMGADLFILVPPVRECGVQAIAICPRRFEKIARLLPAPYELKKMRLLINTKADAVLGASNEASRKVMVSVVGSHGVSLPSQWFKVATGAETLSVAITVAQDSQSRNQAVSFEAINSLPARASVESRVDVGNDNGITHSTRKRTSVEVSTIELPPMPNLLVGRSPLSVEGGQCYLFAQWSEESV